MGTQIKRGYDWRVTFTPNDTGIGAITFNAQSKQLVGASGEEVPFMGDAVDELTEKKTSGKPTLSNAVVVAEWDATIFGTLKLLNSRGNGVGGDDGKGSLSIISLVAGGDGQKTNNCYVLSCVADPTSNNSKMTMTVTFMPEGGVVANSPTTLTAGA